MSYILDALRRADSERERGGVPGIHAQPVMTHWRDARQGRRMRPWVGALIGLSVVVLGAFAWHLAGREALPEVAPRAAPVPMPVTAAPRAPVPAPQPAVPAAQTPPAPPTAAVAVAPSPPAAKAAERPRAPASSSPEAARRKATPPPADAPNKMADAAALRAPAKTEPGAATPAADARVYTPNELPQDVRRQLPNLAFGGSMYSETPSSRMLIVNGQLVHEGATLAPDLTLERIKLRSAVLRFKGYRYEINY